MLLKKQFLIGQFKALKLLYVMWLQSKHLGFMTATLLFWDLWFQPMCGTSPIIYHPPGLEQSEVCLVYAMLPINKKMSTKETKRACRNLLLCLVNYVNVSHVHV